MEVVEAGARTKVVEVVFVVSLLGSYKSPVCGQISCFSASFERYLSTFLSQAVADKSEAACLKCCMGGGGVNAE